MEVSTSAALEVELRSIQNQYTHALQNHQIWFDKQLKHPNDLQIKKQIYALQMHLKALDESQRRLVLQLRKGINNKSTILHKREKIKNARQNNTFRSQIMSSSSSNNTNNSSISSNSGGIERTPQVTIRPPPPPPLTSAPGVKLFSRNNIQAKITAKGGRKTTASPKSSPPLALKNSTFNKNEVSKKDINDKNSQTESSPNTNSSNLISEQEATPIPPEITQREFLRALNLITRDELYELQNRRVERKRRSTANHSQYVYDDSWDCSKRKRRNYLNNGQAAPPSTRQITRSQVKGNANNSGNSKSGKISPPAVGPKKVTSNNQAASKRKKSNPPSDEDETVLKEDKEIKRKIKTPSPPPLKAAPVHFKELIQKDIALNKMKTKSTKIEIDSYSKSFSSQQEKRIPSLDEIIIRDGSSTSIRGCSLIVRSEPPSSDRYKRCVDSVHINRIGMTSIEDMTQQALPLNIQKLPASLTIERVDKDRICVICREIGPQSICHECDSPYHKHACGNAGKCRTCNISGMDIVQQYLKRTQHQSITISSHSSLNCSNPFSSLKTSLNTSVTVTTVPAQTNKLKIDFEEKARLLVVNRELMTEKEKLESRKAELNKKIQAQSDFRRTLKDSEKVYQTSIHQIEEFVQKMHSDPRLTTLTIANLEIKPSRPFMSS